MRSATAPEISVVAVPMNPSWKRKKATRYELLLSKKNDDEPIVSPALRPNMRPKPNKQQREAATRKFAKFLIAPLTEFFDRTSPLSSAVKPACMKSTSAAATSSQAMSMGSAGGGTVEANLDRTSCAEWHKYRQLVALQSGLGFAAARPQRLSRRTDAVCPASPSGRVALPAVAGGTDWWKRKK